MAPSKKLVVVLGATGAQGTPVVEYLLKHSSDAFTVRAVTRDSTTNKAQALQKLGAELAVADLDDESALRDTLRGANAIFCLTDFYDKSTIDAELTRGLLVSQIASELPNLENFIYSSLPDARSLFGGKYQLILPYNSKTYIKEGIQRGYPSLWKKTTVLLVGYYYQNWLKYTSIFGPQKQPDGKFILSMPHAASDFVSMASSLDTGVVVDAILKAGSKYHGRTVALVAERITEQKKLEIWSKVLGVNIEFQQVSEAEFKKQLEGLGIPSVLAGGMSQLAAVYAGPDDYVETQDVIKGREILAAGQTLKTWEEYIKEEDWSALLRSTGNQIVHG